MISSWNVWYDAQHLIFGTMHRKRVQIHLIHSTPAVKSENYKNKQTKKLPRTSLLVGATSPVNGWQIALWTSWVLKMQ